MNAHKGSTATDVEDTDAEWLRALVDHRSTAEREAIEQGEWMRAKWPPAVAPGAVTAVRLLRWRGMVLAARARLDAWCRARGIGA